ncbi:MAG: carbon starvation protein A [bacterium]|nr:carbon starvation protein A [bacterium]
MITFLIGIFILILGYVFYSRYVEKQFSPDDRKTPAYAMNDKVDFVPLSTPKNLLIHLLNIAGLGPILGVIQGILFGPVAFLLIPLGCVFMGGVHDYFSGMISERNNGAQITDLIQQYLGKTEFKIFLLIVSIMLLLLASVFVYTSGDIMAQRFFNQSDFSFNNPIMATIYIIIAMYYIIAALFPIDKIIGKFYPVFAATLILGSLLVVIGFFTKGVQLQEFNIHHINFHPNGLHILPMFFMTVSCGLLSGFHSTQSTIISRTIKTEQEGRKVFYGMMCVESLIAMIWAAATMHVYSLKLVPENLIGSANVINSIADTFVAPILAFVVTIAVVILPITSGDTALRALRMSIADALNLKQSEITNRLKVIIPTSAILLGIIYWAKINPGSFTLIWRYFTFVNQLIAIPTFIYATIFLYKNKKNYFITLLPGLFYIFITMSFIFNAKIGFGLPYVISQWIGVIFAAAGLFYIIKKIKKQK